MWKPLKGTIRMNLIGCQALQNVKKKKEIDSCDLKGILKFQLIVFYSRIKVAHYVWVCVLLHVRH